MRMLVSPKGTTDLHHVFADLPFRSFFNQCYCGNTDEKFGPSGVDGCDKTCAYDVNVGQHQDQMCGGTYRMSVFEYRGGSFVEGTALLNGDMPFSFIQHA